MRNTVRSFKYFALIVCLSFASISSATATLITSDFSFGSGTPFGGVTTLGGIGVTVTTTNTEPFGGTSFRDQLNTDPSLVTFVFSAPVTEFSLTISRVRPPEEFLTGFNIGDPTTLTGDLVNIGGNITSSVPGDFGTGSLIWTGINTSIISFTIGNDPTSALSPALAVDAFGISRGSVPAPAAFSLLLGLLGISFAQRRRFPK